MKTDVRVVQHITYSSLEQIDESYQIEVGNQVLENLSREQMELIKSSIYTALSKHEEVDHE